MTSGGQRRAAIENTDIIQTKKTSLKDVHSLSIFPIDPPRKIQKKFLENALKKNCVPNAALLLVDLINAPCGPGVDWWIYITERPLVCRQLPVRMHVPLAGHQHELFFRKLRVDQCQRDAVKRQVPCSVPGVFPLVRHGDDVGVVKIWPLMIAAAQTIFRRRRCFRIAFEPLLNYVMIELFRPKHSCERLPHYVACVSR